MSNIFQRISDVVTANLNDLVDRVEDPERMIKQFIRDREANVREAKESVIQAIASEKRLEKDLALNRQQTMEWAHSAEAALRSGNEDLAKSALARKKEHEHICKALEPSWQFARSTSERLKAELRALESKLEEARRKRGLLVGRQRAAAARDLMDKAVSNLQAQYATEHNFARMEDKVAEMEARSAAIEELNAEATHVERSCLAVEMQTEIDEELALLKAKIVAQ